MIVILEFLSDIIFFIVKEGFIVSSVRGVVIPGVEVLESTLIPGGLLVGELDSEVVAMQNLECFPFLEG